MTEPQCSVEPLEAEEAAGASAGTAAQAEFAGAPSPGTPVQDEVSEVPTLYRQPRQYLRWSTSV